jgi:hypothetical protein
MTSVAPRRRREPDSSLSLQHCAKCRKEMHYLRTADYVFEDWDGTELFHKIRYECGPVRRVGEIICPPDKTFRYGWRDPKTDLWLEYKPERHPRQEDRVCASFDADDFLYQLPMVGDGIRQGKTIVWCEGEKDADALIERGYVATTHHQGMRGRKWVITERQAYCLAEAAEVLIVGDVDEHSAGYWLMWQKYCALKDVGVKNVQIRLWVPKGFKDVSEDIEDYEADGSVGRWSFHDAGGRYLRLRKLRELADRYQPGEGSGWRYNQGDE